jgi:elongation factor Ts
MLVEMEKLDTLMAQVAITTEMVRDLRQYTGEGMMSCHKALKHSGGDMRKAVDYLRTSGNI